MPRRERSAASSAPRSVAASRRSLRRSSTVRVHAVADETALLRRDGRRLDERRGEAGREGVRNARRDTPRRPARGASRRSRREAAPAPRPGRGRGRARRGPSVSRFRPRRARGAAAGREASRGPRRGARGATGRRRAPRRRRGAPRSPPSSPSGCSRIRRRARAPNGVPVRSTTDRRVPVRPPSRSERKSSRCPCVTASTTRPSPADSVLRVVTWAQSAFCVERA